MIQHSVERIYTQPDAKTEHQRRYPEHWERYGFALEHLRGKRVIDVGCGSGYGTSYLGEKSDIYILGLDSHGPAIKWANKHYGSSADFIHIDDNACWPLPSDFADTVVSLETLEHTANPAPFISEISRILKPTGRLILSTPLNETAHRTNPSNPYHIREYSWRELSELLTENGDFRIISRWSQVSQLGAAWGKTSRRWPFITTLIKGLLPQRWRAFLRRLLTTSHRLKAGTIHEGFTNDASVQLVIAEVTKQ